MGQGKVRSERCRLATSLCQLFYSALIVSLSLWWCVGGVVGGGWKGCDKGKYFYNTGPRKYKNFRLIDTLRTNYFVSYQTEYKVMSGARQLRKVFHDWRYRLSNSANVQLTALRQLTKLYYWIISNRLFVFSSVLDNFRVVFNLWDSIYIQCYKNVSLTIIVVPKANN